MVLFVGYSGLMSFLFFVLTGKFSRYGLEGSGVLILAIVFV